jgi:Tfp pilus assembly protein PilZ
VPDTRAHPRYALEIDAEIKLGEEQIPARTRNVSKGGLCIVTEQPLPVGQDVTVTIALVFEEQTMSDPLPLRGRVVWCTPLEEGRYQVGATFVGLTGDQRVYVELFLRYLKDA